MAYYIDLFGEFEEEFLKDHTNEMTCTSFDEDLELEKIRVLAHIADELHEINKALSVNLRKEIYK